MIYLIGGPPRSGKTTLAKRLSARLRIGWVSTDTLESIVREHTPAKDQPKRFPKNVLRKKAPGGNDDLYTKFSAKEIAHAYLTQGKACDKAITAFVADCVSEGHDFVLEGYQLGPKLVAELVKRFPREIRVVFLVKQDVRALVEGFGKNSAKNDWVLQKTKKAATFEKIARMLSYFGARIKAEAERYRFPVECMDKDFLKTIAALETRLARR